MLSALEQARLCECPIRVRGSLGSRLGSGLDSDRAVQGKLASSPSPDSDPDGDPAVYEENGPTSTNGGKGVPELAGGTGKYAGIQGSGEPKCKGEWNYKVPLNLNRNFGTGNGYGGESGIRTRGTGISRTHAFQACTFNHSVI